MRGFAVYPALDLMGGRAVRLKRGDFAGEPLFSLDPMEVAAGLREAGIPRLHVVDLDGARLGRPAHLAELSALCSMGFEVSFGGGLRDLSSMEEARSRGASYLMLGSALKRRDLLEEALSRFGDAVRPCVDVREGRIAVEGWREKLDVPFERALEELQGLEVFSVLVSSVERDGTGLGPDLELFSAARRCAPRLRILAAGGIRDAEDLRALRELGLWGCVVGRALYEGTMSLRDISEV